MDAPEIAHTRYLAEAYGLEPSVTLNEIVEAIVGRTPITGGTNEWTSVLEVVGLVTREPAWSALLDKQPIPPNTVNGLIAAVDQHKPAIPPAMVVDIVLHDIQQALAGFTPPAPR
jgi:hypothetical protein